MISFCKYKDIFGQPRTGIHSTRIPGIDLALFDVLPTIILAFVIWLIATNRKSYIKLLLITVLLFIFAVLVHYIFCVDTQLNKYIFG